MPRGKPKSTRPRFRKNFWKMVATAIYYGMLVQVGSVQSKTLLCRLTKTYDLGFTVNEFWMLYGLFIVLFTLLDYFLLQSAAKILKVGKFGESQTQAVCKSAKMSRCTRSGKVYGYM